MGQAKQRGTYEERVKQAQMPSFIVQIELQDNKLSYDKTGLLDNQIKFADTCLSQLQSQYNPTYTNLGGYVYWGNNKDFAAHIGEYKSPQAIDEGWRMARDMFFATYWDTTNQAIDIGEDYCDEIIGATKPQPMGVKLKDVPKHNYTNFAIAVAWTRQNLSIAKMSIGDLSPPEVDPKSNLYRANFADKVQEAVANFGMKVDLDFRPGYMCSKLIEETA
jgi:hypothetical protein